MTPDDLREVECCDLVTQGHRTGREHRVEIWFGVVGGRLCLISGNGVRAHWYRNLRADPNVTIVLGDSRFPGRASVVTDAAERREIGEVMRAKYVWDGDPDIGLTYDVWCYEVPAVWIDVNW